MLALYCAHFLAVHYRVRSDLLGAARVRGLRVSAVGQCAGLVYSWIIDDYDTGGGGVQDYRDAGHVSAGEFNQFIYNVYHIIPNSATCFMFAVALNTQRMKILTTPWRDTQRNLNGGVILEPAQVRLTASNKEGEEV